MATPIRVIRRAADSPELPAITDLIHELTGLQYSVDDARSLFGDTVDGMSISQAAKDAIKAGFDDLLTALQTLQTDPIMEKFFDLKITIQEQGLLQVVSEYLAASAWSWTCLLVCPSIPPLPGTHWQIQGWRVESLFNGTVTCTYACIDRRWA